MYLFNVTYLFGITKWRWKGQELSNVPCILKPFASLLKDTSISEKLKLKRVAWKRPSCMKWPQKRISGFLVNVAKGRVCKRCWPEPKYIILLVLWISKGGLNRSDWKSQPPTLQSRVFINGPRLVNVVTCFQSLQSATSRPSSLMLCYLMTRPSSSVTVAHSLLPPAKSRSRGLFSMTSSKYRNIRYSNN